MSEQGNGLGDNTTCVTGVSQGNAASTDEKSGKKKNSSDQYKGARPKSGKKKFSQQGSAEGSGEKTADGVTAGHSGKDRPRSGRPRSAKKEQKCSDGDFDTCHFSGKSKQPKQNVISDSVECSSRKRGHGNRRQENNHGNNLQTNSQRRNVQQNGRSSDQKNAGKSVKHHRKKIFESHLSEEELSQGLKFGRFIQGPLNVNQKKYEESYVAHPDGVSDVLMNSMKERNRAFNGDIVAVQIYDYSSWLVYKKHLEDFVKTLESECKPPDKGSIDHTHKDTKMCHDSDKDGVIKSGCLDASIDNTHEDTTTCHDSDSDVVIESDETVEYDSCNKVVKTVHSSKTADDPVKDVTKRLHKTSISDQGTSSAKVKEEQFRNYVQNLLSPARGSVDNNAGPKLEDQNPSHDKEATPKKFLSLQEVLKDGSPTLKNLFDSELKSSANGNWNDVAKRYKFIIRTGKVVGILESKMPRLYVGHLKPMKDGNPNRTLFSPLDNRISRIMVPMSDCPKDFHERPKDHSKTLFIARVDGWEEDSKFSYGTLVKSLGEAGEIEAETEGILIENDVDSCEFTEEALDSLPIKKLPWCIPPQEMEKRRDFRSHCIFTIDPATARDLDDALSVEKCEDGTYNVGVHIADVSYFLEEGTALDKVASRRATSVYLVQKVIPMLPRILCEQLCSLNPDEDRLTFSVVWNMSETGEVYDEWFGRSIIRSCCKLTYDHAQGFIEEPERNWTSQELPPISSAFTAQQIKERVLNLHKIAVNLRKLRFDNGALRLDQVKISFTLDSETGMPNGHKVYEQKDSNRLVEEFMLLANMAVAHKINGSFPKTALLRRHPPPKLKPMEDVAAVCDSQGIQLDISSAGALQRSIWSHCGDDEFSTARMQVLTAWCARPMQNARYFCTGSIDDESEYRHYALNVPLYTHFTSPIRRYADVMVHRTLAAALGYSEYKQDLQAVQKQSDQCNDKKMKSKIAQDLSNNLFFAVFVKEAGPFEELGMVMGVMDKAFDVFMLKLGVTKRVYCDNLLLKDKVYTKEQRRPVLTLTWAASKMDPREIVQRIEIFSLVKCELKAGNLPLLWMATIARPEE